LSGRELLVAAPGLAHGRRAEAAAQLLGFARRHHLDQSGGALVPAEERALACMRRLGVVQIGARRCDALAALGATLSLAEAVRIAIGE
jgi:hypothetical protein